MDVTELLDRVGDVAQRRRRVRGDFSLWHCWQSRHWAATWDGRHGHTKQLEINRLVALILRCARLYAALKIGWRKSAGISTLTPQRRCLPEEVYLASSPLTHEVQRTSGRAGSPGKSTGEGGKG